MSTEVLYTLDAKATIRDPHTDNRAENEKYYCTETEWRDFTQLTNQSDFPSSMIISCLTDATEQIKKDAFYYIEREYTTPDSSGRYFTFKKFWGNAYSMDSNALDIRCGNVTKYDIIVWDAENIATSPAGLYITGTRRNQIIKQIPYSAITEIDPLNGYFKLSSEYPVSGHQVLVSYWVVGKPLDSLAYELKRACIEMTTILAYRKLKTKRLKKGTVQYTLGKQTITRDEATFDKLVDDHKKEYENWIRWFRPFIGRKVKIGRMETYGSRVILNRY